MLLIRASAAVITIGTHLQAQSPRFGEFQQAEIARQAGTDGEERLNPAGRMALMLSGGAGSWPWSRPVRSGWVA